MLPLGLALDENFHGLPFLLFFFAILISSALFDRGSGAFSVVLSAFFAKWFFIAPTGMIRVENTGGLIALSCFRRHFEMYHRVHLVHDLSPCS
jgi:K+-sensing histidine kinase KdpD